MSDQMDCTVYSVAYKPPFSEAVYKELSFYEPEVASEEYTRGIYRVDILRKAVESHGSEEDYGLLKKIEDAGIDSLAEC